MEVPSSNVAVCDNNILSQSSITHEDHIENIILSLSNYKSIVFITHLVKRFPHHYEYAPLNAQERAKILNQDIFNLKRKDASHLEKGVVYNRISHIFDSCAFQSECDYYEFREFMCIYAELGFTDKFLHYSELVSPYLEELDLEPVVGGDAGHEAYYNHLHYEYVPNGTHFLVYLYDELVGTCLELGGHITPLPPSFKPTSEDQYDSVYLCDVRTAGVVEDHEEDLTIKDLNIREDLVSPPVNHFMEAFCNNYLLECEKQNRFVEFTEEYRQYILSQLDDMDDVPSENPSLEDESVTVDAIVSDELNNVSVVKISEQQHLAYKHLAKQLCQLVVEQFAYTFISMHLSAYLFFHRTRVKELLHCKNGRPPHLSSRLLYAISAVT